MIIPRLDKKLENRLPDCHFQHCERNRPAIAIIIGLMEEAARFLQNLFEVKHGFS